MEILNQLQALIAGSIKDALALDWSSITYRREDIVLRAVIVLVAAFFIKTIVNWRRPR